MDTSLGAEFLTLRVRDANTNEWEKVSHPMEYKGSVETNL